MKTMSFSGPTEVDHKQEAYIWECVNDLSADLYVSGAAVGVDTVAALAAYAQHPLATVRFCVPKACWYNDRLVSVLRGRPNIEIEEVSGGYMTRNDRLVELADTLVAFPRTRQEVLRSGTWATIRRARKAGVPVYLFPLEEA